MRIIKKAGGGGAGSGTSKLMCRVDHDAPSDFTIPHYTSTRFAWPVVNQGSSIYNSATGVFTIQETGVYSMQLSIYADIPTLVAGGVSLNVNGSGFFALEFMTRGDGVRFVGSDIIFEASAGDAVALDAFVNAAPDGGTLLAEYFSTINKIYLFKL